MGRIWGKRKDVNETKERRKEGRKEGKKEGKKVGKTTEMKQGKEIILKGGRK